ncbi:unnamed protein product [Clonostachys byssicola]|uniref:YjgF-like protein n=1 Tax=Clonostachys byssicola TaxID=160290 RepID=A0A9N9TY28_9HYPO|nr:unnamed protein product [Clonostachys byssicola]
MCVHTVSGCGSISHLLLPFTLYLVKSYQSLRDTITDHVIVSDLSVIPVPPTQPTVYLLRTAGQLGTPPRSSKPVSSPLPNTFAEQAANAFQNVSACLAVANAAPSDVSKLNIYGVNLTEALRDIVAAAVRDFFGDSGHAPPSVLIGVSALAIPGFLIEVEAEAAIEVD